MLHNLLTEIVGSEVKLYICSFDLFNTSSVGFGWREEVTQHAAKLQL